jgi:hypothetical protein
MKRTNHLNRPQLNQTSRVRASSCQGLCCRCATLPRGTYIHINGARLQGNEVYAACVHRMRSSLELVVCPVPGFQLLLLGKDYTRYNYCASEQGPRRA